MTYIIFDTLYTFITVAEYAAIISVILSWVAPFSRIKSTIDWLLSPLVLPFRYLNMKLVSKLGIPLDFSYLMFFFGLRIIRTVLVRLQMTLML